MNKRILGFLPALLFIITGVMAIVQQRDYWEAASWFSFSVTVLIFALKPGNQPETRNARMLAYFFGLLGLVLLVLRITGVLPVPVRPLP